MKRKRNIATFTILVLAGTLCATSLYAEEAALTLGAKQRDVVSIAAFTATGDTENLKRALNDGLDDGLTVNEIGEVLLQMYAYAGFPRSLNGMGALSALLEERQSQGIRDSFGTEPDFLPEDADRYAVGVSNLGTLMGFPLDQRKAETNGYDDAMDAFLKEHLFADIFGRDNLSFETRELATIGALSALEGTNSQLMFHMNAAMNCGVSEEQMDHFVDVIDEELGAERGGNAESVLARVLERRSGNAGRPTGNGDNEPYVPELFPRGERTDIPMIFTGNPWLSFLVPRDAGVNASVSNVTFEPDSRTKWHAHADVQVLLVTLGRGYYQAEGEEPRMLQAGDTVIIRPGVKHWHGSAPGEWFAHISLIVPAESDAENQWLEPVSDEDYFGLD